MKTTILLVAPIAALFICSFLEIDAQNTFPASGPVGIGTAAPNASSVFEVKSTTKGVLFPRMTSAQRAAIVSPTTGLLLYQTDGTTGFYYYSGGWKALVPPSPNTALSNLVATSINQSLVPSATGSRDLGSAAKRWKDLFLTGNITSTSLSTTYASNLPTAAPFYIAKRSRGTLTSPLAVSLNDIISSIGASAYDGGTFQTPAAIDFLVDGPPSPGNVPASISFLTGNNQGNRRERLKIGSNGNFIFNDNQLFLEKATGRLSIGTRTIANSKLNIENTEASIGLSIYNNLYQNPGDGIGIWVHSAGLNGNGVGAYITGANHGIMSYGQSYYTDPDGSEVGVGVYGVGFVTSTYGNSGTAIGIKGLGDGGASNYGVLGFTNNHPNAFNAAGFFEGDVHAINYFTVSDRKFKEDIKHMPNSLDKLMLLKPSSYVFKKSENLRRMGAPTGKQLGLVADEVKNVFPELVIKAIKPAYYDTARKEIDPQEGYEAINYLGLIPVLISSVQEQQKQIKELNEKDEKIAQLEARLLKLEALILSSNSRNPSSNISSAYLQQSIPNPSRGNIIIGYHLPGTSATAKLVITDVKGRLIKSVNLTNTGNSQITLDNSALSAGTYTYTLYVQGKQVDSKQMVVIR